MGQVRRPATTKGTTHDRSLRRVRAMTECRLCGEDVTPGADGTVTDPEPHRGEHLTFHVECVRTLCTTLAILRRRHPRLANLIGAGIAGQRGGADLTALLVGVLLALVAAAALAFAGTASSHALTIDTVSTVPVSLTATPETPTTTAAAPAATSGVLALKVATGPAAVVVASTTTTTAPPAATPPGEVSCEVLSDGIDADAGNGHPGWYSAVVPGAVAAAHPEHFRNCTIVAS